METPLIENGHKVLIGFKCPPSLKSALCEQAEKLGVKLSSHVETIVLNQENKQKEITNLSEQFESIKKRVAFYENSYLKELYENNKGKTYSFKKSRTGETINLTINDITDAFTIIINSFKTDQ
jgi:hypothetical protein